MPSDALLQRATQENTEVMGYASSRISRPLGTILLRMLALPSSNDPLLFLENTAACSCNSLYGAGIITRLNTDHLPFGGELTDGAPYLLPHHPHCYPFLSKANTASSFLLLDICNRIK
ncbi:hypothetical protein NP233_g12572 [Leucocoprinus birnbaumii]|uniref:Uncharacterized protein n=1 Tax=Leucocoprinus birnbaumii TaxID=56174 RepID=A0AAD5VGR0_9AGAR|nr:hypothetical protein NP233_g12572 [Leucocoprinus birnbaumii]